MSALPGSAASRLLHSFVLVLLASGLSAHAAALRAEFNALAPRPRSQAPAPVEVKLHWQGAGLLEGVLELTLIGDGTPVLRQRTHELALTAGTQTLRLLLPPRFGRDYIPQTEAHLRFLGKKGAIDLGSFPVSNSSYDTRSFLIGVCGAPSHALDGRPQLWQALRPERFLADSTTSTAKLATSPMMMDAADLPASPLALCAFDLVLLEGDSFARLREKQLSALATWIEAGGSLCLAAESAVREEHVQFLNKLAARPGNAEPFRMDERNRLANTWNGMAWVSAGFGRMVVIAQPPETAVELEAVEWKRSAAFLWNARADRLDVSGNAADQGKRKVPAAEYGPDWVRQPGGGITWGVRDPAQTRREHIQQYLDTLLPQSARLIPMPVVAAILGAFVLVVGPGEWIVLGWLRRRRWTWITFPIVAAAFTALTVAAAEHYLGRTDHRASIVVTDLTPAGRPLRESRIELIFTARDLEVTSDLRQTLAVPTQFTTRFAARGSSEPRGEREPPLYSGQFPMRAALGQRARQWTPQVNRSLTFDVSTDDSRIRWDAVGARELNAQPDPARWFSQRAGAAGFTVHVLRRAVSAAPAGSDQREFWFCQALSILPPTGLGAFVERIAPSGDADLQDLALLASDNQLDALVVAIKKLPNETRIYRCLYRPNE